MPDSKAETGAASFSALESSIKNNQENFLKNKKMNICSFPKILLI